MRLVEKYYELFNELPYMPITSNLSSKEFDKRIEKCISLKVRLQELYPDDYDEPEGVLI